jgi:uncharacterized membrane protein
MIQTPLSVLTVLLLVLAGLFLLPRTAVGRTIFGLVPLLVFCYFVPALLSNLGGIPSESELYVFIRRVLLPASLVLLVLSTDVPAVVSLGRDAVLLFLAGTASVALGGRWHSWRSDGCFRSVRWIRHGAASPRCAVPGSAVVPISSRWGRAPALRPRP